MTILNIGTRSMTYTRVRAIRNDRVTLVTSSGRSTCCRRAVIHRFLHEEVDDTFEGVILEQIHQRQHAVAIPGNLCEAHGNDVGNTPDPN